MSSLMVYTPHPGQHYTLHCTVTEILNYTLQTCDGQKLYTLRKKKNTEPRQISRYSKLEIHHYTNEVDNGGKMF